MSTEVNFQRGKIRQVTVGPRWRVRHHAYRGFLPPPKNGVFDIVGAATEEEAKETVEAAYTRPRVIVGVERLD